MPRKSTHVKVRNEIGMQSSTWILRANATTTELRLLRGKTIECISLIGLAVGPEKFTADASEVMEMLLKTQTGDAEMSDDDPQVHCLSIYSTLNIYTNADAVYLIPN